MSNSERYHWIPQDCPICDAPPTTLLGKRGGSAHRAGLGVECNVWRCDQCGLIFPNPMPVPVKGLEQHYGVDPMEYFEHHHVDQKDTAGKGLGALGRTLIGAKRKLLRTRGRRGGIFLAAGLAGGEAAGGVVAAP